MNILTWIEALKGGAIGLRKLSPVQPDKVKLFAYDPKRRKGNFYFKYDDSFYQPGIFLTGF